MRRLVKKLHTYAGLLSFTAFIVYGVAGLYATFAPAPDARPAAASTTHVDFVTPGDLSDKQLADLVHERLGLPLTRQVPAWALQRDDASNLVIDFHTPNGVRRVTVLEDANQLRVESANLTTAAFLNRLHAAMDLQGPPVLAAWAAYNIFSTLCLLGMALSGLYLWLASRPGHRLAQWAFGAGSAAFLIMVWAIW